MNDLNPEKLNNTMRCRECPAGVMHRKSITYFTWLGEELVTVPDFPAWVCDLCGKREYDEQAVTTLSMILNPEAGKPSRRVKRTPKSDSTKKKFAQPGSTEGQ